MGELVTMVVKPMPVQMGEQFSRIQFGHRYPCALLVFVSQAQNVGNVRVTRATQVQVLYPFQNAVHTHPA
jgi:hypothetical protein